MIFLDVKGGLFCKKRMDELDGWTEVVFLDGEDGWMERSGNSGCNKREACRSVA